MYGVVGFLDLLLRKYLRIRHGDGLKTLDSSAQEAVCVERWTLNYSDRGGNSHPHHRSNLFASARVRGKPVF